MTGDESIWFPVAKLHSSEPFDPPPTPKPVLSRFAWNFGQGDDVPDVTVNVAFSANVPWVAVIVAAIVAGTGEVVIVNSAVVAPAATVTLDGVNATGSLDDKLIAEPPGPAGTLKVTVPIEEVPPTTDVGESVKLLKTAGGVMVNVAVTETVPALAVIVEVVVAVTTLVVTAKVAEEAPAATVKLVGVTALVVLEDNVTTNPPAGAGPSSVTVPVEVVPP